MKTSLALGQLSCLLIIILGALSESLAAWRFSVTRKYFAELGEVDVPA